VDAAALETLALRAVELAVQSRNDPRFLVASLPKAPGPKKAARYLAGLANACGKRAALLLLGVSGHDIVGLDTIPTDDYWQRVDDRFPSEHPTCSRVDLTVGSTRLVAVHVEPTATLVVAPYRDRPVVPWFADGRLRRATPPVETPRPTLSDKLPTLRVDDVWVEHRHLPETPEIAVYRGAVDITLEATPGRLRDDDVSVTLLVPGPAHPVAMTARIHPLDTRTGVARTDDGIEVLSAFRARIYLATARREPADEIASTAAQMVIAVLLPGRSVPEIRSVGLGPDPGSEQRWVL
jgi:hypothetical protein